MLSLGTIATKVFGSSNERKLKKYAPIVAKINALEPELEALSDEDLRARTEQRHKLLGEIDEIEFTPGEDYCSHR